MRKVLVIGVVAASVLSGCVQTTETNVPATSRTSRTGPASSTTTATAPDVPPAPEPVASGPCPYLQTRWVARTNGQRVSEVRVSEGRPPACFFYTLSGELQIMARIYNGGDPDVATAIVNNAAPIRKSNPAEQPGGWKGGYMSTADGAVYAVSRGGTAVVVTTNQKQSVKAREVVERVIRNLDL